MKKRLLSLLLVLSLTLSMLPGTAMAAVSGLLDNTPEQNQDLLEQLENFNGENYEEAYDLLDSLGLLDQDGDLLTDQAIVLDGEEYALEEIEALLDDPDTDLSRTGYVDGTPIALGDLKTIIAIERELARIREKYFSDRTFEGEAVDNLNDLMDQLQTSGISLQSGDISQPDSGVRVAYTTHMDALTQGDGYVSAQTSFSGGSGETLTVTAAYEPGLAGADSATVTLGSDTATLTAESPTATLTHTASSDDEAVDLSVRLDCSGDAPGMSTATSVPRCTSQSPRGSYFNTATPIPTLIPCVCTELRPCPISLSASVQPALSKLRKQMCRSRTLPRGSSLRWTRR